MGNMIGSVEDEFSSLKYNHLKTKGVTNTAAGRHSVPILIKQSKKEKVKEKIKEKTSDVNFKIYREIFPPPSNEKMTRNTICPTMNNIYFVDRVKSEEAKIEENSKENEIKEKKSNEVLNMIINEEESIFRKKTEENFQTENFDGNRKKSNEFELKFVKSGEDIRRSYIAKLIYNKIWQPTIKEKDHNSLIIFDWDDTLLCTSFLTPNGVFLEDTKVFEKDFDKIKKLDISSANILKQAINRGETYIITNAAPGWVEYSANRFYPEVAKLLKSVTIVSARGEYEKKFPGDSRQWKILAFLETLKNFDTNLVTNLICLGDSVIEMEAAHILASKFTHAYIKTIKFREAPKPEELHKQLGLVIDQFDKIFSAVKNLTIRVEKKSKEESTPPKK